ncbi:MAG: alpha/beta hydrolase [Thermoleophilia bacterium]
MSVAELNGARIAYDVTGSGPVVTLIHAGIADRRMWRDAVPALADEFTVLTYDQRGFGDSTLPSGPATYTDDLRALLEHVDIERTVLVGVSMGGRTALELTLLHPERVSHLVLVGAGLPDWAWSAEMQRADEEETAAFDAGDFERAIRGNVEFWIGSASSEVRDLSAEMQRRAFAIPVPDPEPSSPPPLDPPASQRLSEIDVPTLVVVGENDVDDFKQIAGALAEGIPGARKVTMTDTAHLPPLEHPEEFNRILLDFLHTESR